jgi:small subunit ribosomal protein S9
MAPRTTKKTNAASTGDDEPQPTRTQHAHTTSTAHTATPAEAQKAHAHEAGAATAAQKKDAAKPRVSRKKIVSIVERGKRKESVARASIKKGTGIVRINAFRLETYTHPYLRALMQEPVLMAGDLAKDLDITVLVHGGGQSAQAEAARQAIARSILKFTGNAELKQRMEEKDRFMLVEDSRRVEPKKYKGPKARARFQKSYR